MAELDKFKRRLIRSVARLLHKEKRTQAEVWETMRKETGRDCEEIWKRMRILTLKKLCRLLAADDYAYQVGKIARMSLTDWLMFDMVLVHEKVDVITVDKSVTDTNLTAHSDLFELVTFFKIETEPMDLCSRAEAWAGLTVKYNETGRECSPMLLQLRWYQLKETTRVKFYQFWEEYRGNKKKLSLMQQQFEPTPLETAIAKRFSNVVTDPFMDWEQQINEHKVVLLDQFVVLNKDQGESSIKKVFDLGCFLPADNFAASASNASGNANEPDVVLLEPKIETITLGDESDADDVSEVQTASDSDKQINEAVLETNITETHPEAFQRVVVKKEPMEIIEIPHDPDVDGLSNVEIVSSYHVPTEELDETEDNETELATKQLQLINVAEKGNACTDSEIDCFIKDNAVINEEDHATEKQVEESEEENENNGTAKHPEVQDLESMKDPEKRLDLHADIVEIENQDIIKDSPKEVTEAIIAIGELPSNLEFLDDGIDMDEEYEDDIFHNNQENNTSPCSEPEPTTAQNAQGSDMSEGDDEQTDTDDSDEEALSPKFDLKLMMLPVVYTTKLDHMKLFHDADFESVKNDDLIDNVISESKPVSLKSVNVTPKIEVKSEEKQVVPTTTNCLNIKDIESAPKEDVKLTEIASDIRPQAKEIDPPGTQDDDLIKLAPEDEQDNESSEDEINENLKVKPTSYLFKKLRTRNYTPIQLCKNPDFNTRLKKLSIGFFTSERNRQLLTACKPLTIDLHKSFESKLVNNTIYFVSNSKFEIPDLTKKEKLSDQQLVTVAPSAMPAQSLIDQTAKVDIEDLLPLTRNKDDEVLVAERNKNKVINLPDIDKVRRLNQHLAIAEVSPIQVKNSGMLEISPMVLNDSADASKHIDKKIQEFKKEIVSEVMETSDSETNQSDKEDSLLNSDIVNTDISNTNGFQETIDENEFRKVEDHQKMTIRENFRQFMERLKKPPPVVTCLNPDSVKEILLDNKTKSSKLNRNKNMPQIPWYSTSYNITSTIQNVNSTSDSTKKYMKDESLLTLDTLNKMIIALNGSQTEDENVGLPKKKKGKKSMPPPPKQKTTSVTEVINLVEKETEAERAVKSIEIIQPPPLLSLSKPKNKKNATPKENIVSGVDNATPKETIVPANNNATPEVSIVSGVNNETPKETIVSGINNATPEVSIVTGVNNETPKETIVSGINIATPKVNIVTGVNNATPKVNIVSVNSNTKKSKPQITKTIAVCCWARRKLNLMGMNWTTRFYDQADWHRCNIENLQCTCCCLNDLKAFTTSPPPLAPRRDDCCWARLKLTKLKEHGNCHDFFKPHQCALEDRQCDCCCIKHLVEYETDNLPLKVKPVKSSPNKMHTNCANEIESAVSFLSNKNSDLSTNEANLNVSCVTIVPDLVPLNSHPKMHSPVVQNRNETHNDSVVRTSEDSMVNAPEYLNKSADSDQFILLSDDENDDVSLAHDNDTSIEEQRNFKELTYTPVDKIQDISSVQNQEIFLSTDDVSQTNKVDLNGSPGSREISNLQKGLPQLQQEPNNMSQCEEPIKSHSIIKTLNPPNKTLGVRKVWKTKYVIRCAKKQTVCPINMGPGKILLTDAKIPTELLDPDVAAQIPVINPVDPGILTPEPPAVFTALEIPGLQLPDGVSLVLTPNGDVSYGVVPGFQLDASIKSDLDSILINLQTRILSSLPLSNQVVQNLPGQLGSMPDKQDSVIIDNAGESITDLTDNDESVDNTLDRNTSVATQNNSEIKSDSNEHLEIDTGKVNSDILIDSSCSEPDRKSPDPKENQPLEGGKEKQDDFRDATNVLNNATSATDVIASKIQKINDDNSQIEKLEETKIPPEKTDIQESNQEKEIINKTNNETGNISTPAKKSILSDLMEMSGISSEDVLPAPEPTLVPALFPLQTRLPPLAPLPPAEELTQVTTLAALKFAYQQNARFFKYDVAKESLVIIKVSIEKIKKNTSPPKTKAVIDLTDDPQPEVKTVIKKKRGYKELQAELKSQIQKIKQRNKESKSLLRKCYTSSIIKRKRKIPTTELEMRGKPPTKRTRKPKLEAKIDLDNSDGPIEEEYLVDSSSDSETEKEKRPTKEINLESLKEKKALEKRTMEESADESSDDEPLAKKIMRKKETSPDKNITPSANDPDVEKPIVNDPVVTISEPEPTSDVTQDPVLFEENESQDGSDDFILGA